jgi:hypothetical protein
MNSSIAFTSPSISNYLPPLTSPSRMSRQTKSTSHSVFSKTQTTPDLLRRMTHIPTVDETRVKQLSFWDQENLNYKQEQFDFLSSFLYSVYKKQNNISKLKEMDLLKKIMISSRNINQTFENITSGSNNSKALNKVYEKTKQEQGAILLNSISKTSARFNFIFSSSKAQRQIHSDLQIDIGTLDSLSKRPQAQSETEFNSNGPQTEDNSSNNYYRKIIAEKTAQETMMREDLIKVHGMLKKKKEEKIDLRNKLSQIFKTKLKSDELFYEKQSQLKLKKSNILEEYEKKRNHFKAKGEKALRDAMFSQKIKSAANEKDILFKISLAKKENEQNNLKYKEKQKELFDMLSLVIKEEEFLKCIYHAIVKEQREYYYRILKNGYDVRDEGLVWAVRHLIEMNSNLEYHHFPKFLDNDQIDYLISQARLFLDENFMTIALQTLKNKQIRSRQDDKMKQFDQMEQYFSKIASQSKEENNNSKFLSANAIQKYKSFLKIKRKEEQNEDIQTRLIFTFGALREKYKDAFKNCEDRQSDEHNLQKIIQDIRDSLMLTGDYVGGAGKENCLVKFFAENKDNQHELELILELRDKIKQTKNERERLKKEMIDDFKYKLKNNKNRYVNAKTSLRYDLIFSALFGCNFSI